MSEASHDSGRRARVLFEAAERDRRRLGKLLHNGLCQTLAAAVLITKILAQRLRRGEAVSVAEVDDLTRLLDTSLVEVRGVSQETNPVSERPEGLMTALEQLAEQTARIVPCEFQCAEPVFLRDAESALTLYQIALEAVGNARQHAHATRIVIALGLRPDEVAVSVRDDGKGFTPGANGMRIGGCEIMQARASVLGGSFVIKPAAGGGTEVVAALPHPPKPVC